MCPLCHCETQFANKRERRSKVCKDCPVAGRDFYFDRDYGAASNMQYKAEFFVRSGGYYPAEYISIKQRKKRNKLFEEFMRAVPRRGESEMQAFNNASGVKSQ